jgi:LPXTG-motif cell wall-anchored protein
LTEAVVKKLPIIGLLIGAVAAFFAMRKKKEVSATEDTGSAAGGAGPQE